MSVHRTISTGRSALRLLTLSVLLISGAPRAMLAQRAGEISGRVTYSGNGQPVPGALVTLYDAGTGVLTDRDGRYRIRGVQPGQHLALAALMGCVLVSNRIEVQEGRTFRLDLQLDPPVLDIEGILVTASAESARGVPYSVARLDSEGRVLATSIGSMLQGRLAGVRVIQGSGQPGSEPSILLRGPTSLTGSQAPLVVVDGVLTDGLLSNIDPLDVMHIDVLKGATAAASYGSRGQAGVIEITTRRGPSGESAAPKQPVLIVDGVVTAGSLASLDLAEVVDIRRLAGPVAAVLYGSGAEAGAIDVTTVNGPAPGARALRPVCLDPGKLPAGGA